MPTLELEPTWVPLVRRAKELVRHGHTKKALARDKNGTICSPARPEAVEFCLLGALQRASFELFGNMHGRNFFAAIQVLAGAGEPARQGRECELAHFNNLPETTPEDVCRKFDRALAPFNK